MRQPVVSGNMGKEFQDMGLTISLGMSGNGAVTGMMRNTVARGPVKIRKALRMALTGFPAVVASETVARLAFGLRAFGATTASATAIRASAS